MTPPSKVCDLVDRFHADQDYYRSQRYKETEARQEFIDPFFETLGWDVGNRRGAAAAFREVLLEYSVKMGDTVRAPDYLFRAGPVPKFFVEAKKPAVNLRHGVGPAYQVQRYAWTARLPLSILTDFDEFAIYDCRAEPQPNAPPAASRYRFYTYQDYTTQWDEIAALFSREAVLGGSLEQFAQIQKPPKGAIPVDKAFLAEIDGWRALLARNIYLWDRTLSTRDLNYAVQMTLDRIIFLRIAEDRGIELFGRLRELLKGGAIYPRLLRLFYEADARYNSGLFHFDAEKGRDRPDTLTPKLHIDDEVLAPIIRGLYYPESPYEFSVMPVEVLGNVYEQFLGKVITIGAKARVEVEEKPEVRKAGGVYYTPQYIVDYIVANTVGKLLEGKTPKQVEHLRIADPACGSGSFLIGAFQFLMDWHLQQYVADDPAKKHKKCVYQGPGGDWRLTTAERKRILLNNIFGVDLDSQAVEVTKLSLCLKMLEGETSQSLAFQQSFIPERVLPDLTENIKCGNSLIGPDFFALDSAAQLSEEELYRVNAFDWDAEFPEVMKAGGFDAVIGNPPYIRVHRLASIDKQYFWTRYTTFVAKSDIYACFIESSITLLKDGGLLSFITPNTWTSLESFTTLRKFVLDNTVIEQMVRTPNKVFKDATVKTFVFVLRRTKSPANDVEQNTLVRTIVETGKIQDLRRVDRIAMLGSHLYNLLLHTDNTARELYSKCIQSDITVGSVIDFFYGFKTGDDDMFLAAERRTPTYEPYVRSADVVRYSPLIATGFVDYRPEVMKAHRSTARPGDKQRFLRPKIVVARMGRLLLTIFDDSGLFVKDAMLLLDDRDNQPKLKLLVGILNSRLLQYLYQNHFATIDVLKNALLALPLPVTWPEISPPPEQHQISQLVDDMLDLHKRLSAARNTQDRVVIQRQIDATDRQINRLVYELYELTEEEIAIVEEATKP